MRGSLQRCLLRAPPLSFWGTQYMLITAVSEEEACLLCFCFFVFYGLLILINANARHSLLLLLFVFLLTDSTKTVCFIPDLSAVSFTVSSHLSWCLSDRRKRCISFWRLGFFFRFGLIHVGRSSEYWWCVFLQSVRVCISGDTRQSAM